MPDERNTKSQRWAFTLNNYTPADLCSLSKLYEEGKVTFLLFGKEVGESGTPHLQGYLELSKRQRRRNVVALPGLGRGRVEPAKGSGKENVNYCSKGSQSHSEWQESGVAGPNFGLNADVSQWGSLNPALKQGHRSDLQRVVDDISSGLSFREVVLNNPIAFIRNHGGIKRYFDIAREAPIELFHGPFQWEYPDNIRSVVLRGPSGVGKTCFAKFLLPTALFVSHLDSLGKYDDSVHRGIIFDDMSFTHLHREAQIHLLDYDEPRNIHIRYATAHIPAHTPKIFTTNRDYIFLENDPAIERRVRYILIK